MAASIRGTGVARFGSVLPMPHSKGMLLMLVSSIVFYSAITVLTDLLGYSVAQRGGIWEVLDLLAVPAIAMILYMLACHYLNREEIVVDGRGLLAAPLRAWSNPGEPHQNLSVRSDPVASGARRSSRSVSGQPHLDLRRQRAGRPRHDRLRV